MQTIITILEVNDYKEKRDYSATNLTILAASVSLALLILIPNPTTLVVIVTALSSIIFSISIGLIKDSELTTFLKRTIFAKTGISTEFIPYGPYIDKDKNYNQIVYNPYFLDKAFKTKEKPNNTLEFKTSKELIKFIGNNYKNKKELFNLAFENELQFLYTTLVGMKLEIDEREKTISKKVNGFLQDINRNLYCKTYLKIPETLIDDDTIFLLNNINYDVKNNKFFEKPDKVDYYLFDLQPYHNETIKINTIIVKSSMVDLKYQFEFYLDLTQDPRHKNSLTIKNFKQINFEE